MKKYNSNKDKVETLPKVIETSDGASFTKSLSESVLIANGYYPVEYDSTPSRRYYTSEVTQELVGNTYTVSHTATAVPLAQLKDAMLKDVKDVQISKLEAIDWYWLREAKVAVAVPEAIKTEATYIYSKSSEIESAIAGMVDVDACILYEKTPYDYTITQDDVDDGMEDTLVVGDVQVRYTNNVKDW